MTVRNERHAAQDGAGRLLPPITRSGRADPPPLSLAQERMWFLAQMDGVSQAHHLSLGLQLTGQLDAGVLHRALARLVARHEALRTTFFKADGQPVQRIAPADVGFVLKEHDLRYQHEANETAQRLAIEEVNREFDLEAGPLIRGQLIRFADSEHMLLITMHRIISDERSKGVLIRDLGALYAAYSRGQTDPLPELSIQYPDYSVWQRRWLAEDTLHAQGDYWRRTLADAPAVLELPADRRRPLQQNHAGGSVALDLDHELTAELTRLSQRHGATLFITLLAGWAALLARLSGEDDVVIGAPSANRGQAETEPMIGLFTNKLALRLDLSERPTVGDLLQQVKARTLEAQKHQELPFEQVVEIVRPVRSLAHTPVFQVMFAWSDAAASSLELPGLTVNEVKTPYSFATYDLMLNLAEKGGCIAGGVEYASALFDRATIERNIKLFRRLLQEMVVNDHTAIDRLPLLSEDERHQLLVNWNATEADFPRDKCLHELFEAQVARTPDAVAVTHGSAELTYASLNAKANRLANKLRSHGVKPDAKVAICIERGLDMVSGVLAVLKAGGAYVPLDPAYPPERLAYMLKDSSPLAVITDARKQQMHSGLFHHAAPDARVIAIDSEPEPEEGRLPGNLDPSEIGLTSNHLAYVIYTSGSTGDPKGVAVEHRNAVNFISWTHSSFSADQLKCTLFSTSLNFDLALFECFAPITTGGITHIVRDALELQLSPSEITLVNTVPTVLEAILNQGALPQNIRTVNLAGEPLKQSLADHLFASSQVDRLCNLYGPTETTTYSTWVAIERGESFARHIGRPISNTRIYILDRHREPVPIGVTGEIHIGGAGVAREYLNLPELTAEKFVADPFVREPGSRIYRTGDLGRYLPNGAIEFLGRDDFQVKVRGFRIELGEIEVRLMNHPAVQHAVVVARDDGGVKQLVAYYSLEPAEKAPSPNTLREYLSENLPAHMLPSAYVQLERLPLTANGKINRKALPYPVSEAFSAREYEAPTGDTEKRLAAIWANLLKAGRVGRHDDFFALGGHSLLALRLIARIATEFDVAIDFQTLFHGPTIQGLAASISTTESSRRACGIIQIQPLGDKTPVIFINDTIMYQSYNLARKIGIDRPVIGVQLFDPNCPRKFPHHSVEEIASDYVRLVRKAQPYGPYILFGLCAAGPIAYEIANQLRRDGESVPLVAMADTWRPGYLEGLPAARRTLWTVLSKLHNYRHTLKLLMRGKRKFSDLHIVRMSKRFFLLSTLSRYDDDIESQHHDLKFSWFGPLMEAIGRYLAPSYDGTVVMFRSDEIVTRFADRNMGWSDVVDGRLLVYHIPGWHLDIVQDEGASLIAQYLSPLLKEIG